MVAMVALISLKMMVYQISYPIKSSKVTKEQMHLPSNANVVHLGTKFHAIVVSTASHCMPNCATQETEQSK